MYYKKYFRTRFSLTVEQKKQMEDVKKRLYKQETNEQRNTASIDNRDNVLNKGYRKYECSKF